MNDGTEISEDVSMDESEVVPDMLMEESMKRSRTGRLLKKSAIVLENEERERQLQEDRIRELHEEAEAARARRLNIQKTTSSISRKRKKPSSSSSSTRRTKKQKVDDSQRHQAAREEETEEERNQRRVRDRDGYVQMDINNLERKKQRNRRIRGEKRTVFPVNKLAQKKQRKNGREG